MGAPTQAWRGAVEDRGTEKKDRHPRPCLAPYYPVCVLHKASAHQARPRRAPPGADNLLGVCPGTGREGTAMEASGGWTRGPWPCSSQ